MTVAAPAPTRSRPTPGIRRFGYLVGAGVNLAMLYVVNNLLEWEWFPWLTAEFNDVVPLLSFSIVVTMLWNVAWIGYDAAWFKSIGNIVQSIISLAVTVRLLQVFPFDFAPYDFDWETVTRTVMVIVCVALVIAIVAETIKLLTGRAD